MRAVNEGGLAGRSNFALKDTLFFKLQGSDESMKEVSRKLKAITQRHGGGNFEFARTNAEAEQFWAARKAALWSVLGLKEGARVWTTDVWWVEGRSKVVWSGMADWGTAAACQSPRLRH